MARIEGIISCPFPYNAIAFMEGAFYMDHSEFQTYKDMQSRTNGEVYIGVVGPVRTGKSTFIKRFMELLVLPHIQDENERKRTIDELPQSGSGRTITTTEPKFVPKEAIEIEIEEELRIRVRLVDCVGYMVHGAAGHEEAGHERKVKTPWNEKEISFTESAEIGTRKVIRDHSTIGIVITTDGTVGELSRDAYEEAEERTIRELQEIKKPFIVIVNTKKPYSDDTVKLVNSIEEKYQVMIIALNCEQMQKSDVHKIMKKLLSSFPVTEIRFYLPKWVEMLSDENEIRASVLDVVKELMDRMDYIKNLEKEKQSLDSNYIESINIDRIEMDTGIVHISICIYDKYYYHLLSQLTGENIKDEYELIQNIRKMSDMKKSYEHVKQALESVQTRGYGVVIPDKDEIHIDEPTVVKHGNKYGVKIHAVAPSVHMIRADIETEIAPLVGNKNQAEDLVSYICETKTKDGAIWETNIFGKTVGDLVSDGMKNRIYMINDECQQKLQDTMKKIVNESTGGIVCIII